MTLTERLLAEKLYNAERQQENRTYASGHSFGEWLDQKLNPVPSVEDRALDSYADYVRAYPPNCDPRYNPKLRQTLLAKGL